MFTRAPLAPGRTVYARWRGADQYIIIRQATEVKSPIRHFVCQLYSSLVPIEEFWIFPEFALSSKPIASLTGDSNRKQLTLPV
jgi:hypothetical protein